MKLTILSEGSRVTPASRIRVYELFDRLAAWQHQAQSREPLDDERPNAIHKAGRKSGRIRSGRNPQIPVKRRIVTQRRLDCDALCGLPRFCFW